jgi:hypothetical protein
MVINGRNRLLRICSVNICTVKHLDQRETDGEEIELGRVQPEESVKIRNYYNEN